MSVEISNIKARQILDSRGNPTVEVDILLNDGSFGRAAVPSGASTGVHEALELRDKNESKYHGKSVETAVKNVNMTISNKIIGEQFGSQAELDKFLIDLDGTENKSRLGANAILGVSLAYAWAVSKSKDQMLYEYIGSLYGNTNFNLPRPMFNILNGGEHAGWATDIQEFMVLPMGMEKFDDVIRFGSEVFISLQNLLNSKGFSTNVGNEGGFAPDVSSNLEALELIIEAIGKTKYELGKDVMLGFDVAASEFYDSESKSYKFGTDQTEMNSAEMVRWATKLIDEYPVASIEDPFAEDDWKAWKDFTAANSEKVQIVGDDLLVTNTDRIEKAIKEESCNSLLVKVNQIGTLTETLEAMGMSKKAGWSNVVSHRSGETEDVTISHIAVGTGCGQIKTGAPSRGERTAKYNELIRIAEGLRS
jgi:enolase